MKVRGLRIAAAVLLLSVLPYFAACSPREGSRTEINLLGTTCSVSVFSSRPDSVLDKAFARLWEIDKTMKYSGEESEVHLINLGAGGPGVSVSPSTLDVVERGLYYSALGNGRFDITIGPLVSLWGIGKDEEGTVPPLDEIQKALNLMGYEKVHVEGDRVRLEEAGMSIDLGGIAKGYAADEVASILKENGVESGLINLGGNVFTCGTKPDGSLWRIGVQDPTDMRGSYLGVLAVADKAVVTSGPYERFFIQDGKRYHHILDTETGFPVDNGVISATILASLSMDADGLSTLVFSLGPEAGISLIDSLDGIEALVITGDKVLYPSSGFSSHFTLLDDSFTYAP